MKVRRVVWKFQVPETASGEFFFELTRGAEFLCVQMQGGAPQAWFLVDPKRDVEKRLFKVVGTGNEFDNEAEWSYLGTWQDGPFVWHLFA